MASWARDPESPALGYPWLPEAVLQLAAEPNHWQCLAFTGHLVAGLLDTYEHTFDTWERKDFESQLLPAGWVVEQAAERIGMSIEVAEQFLLYRSLYTMAPDPLLKYLAVGLASRPQAQAAIESEWAPRCGQAAAALALEATGDFAPPARVFRLF